MARTLNTYVTVHRRDDKGEMTGESGTFGPKDALPDWARQGITNPHVWDGADEKAAAEGDSSQYESMKLDELKGALAGRELPTNGNKADLVARLEADDTAKADQK